MSFGLGMEALPAKAQYAIRTNLHCGVMYKLSAHFVIYNPMPVRNLPRVANDFEVGNGGIIFYLTHTIMLS